MKQASTVGSGASPSLGSAVCTLFEGHYHYGVGALLNSLVRHGFTGKVWVGYRGDLPPWASGATRSEHGYIYEMDGGIRVHFVLLETPVFFANYKARFMADLWGRYGIEEQRLFYFDPDIVVKCRWSFYEEWVDEGVALCLDCAYPHMDRTHPLRRGWERFAHRHGIDVKRTLDIYFNTGFLGVRREHAPLLEMWWQIMELIEEDGININSFKNHSGYGDIDRSHPFYVADQDALNLALMTDEYPMSVMGTDAMDFTGAGFTMSHAVDNPKPWKKNFVVHLLRRGNLPSVADLWYMRYVDGPIELYSPLQRRLRWGSFYASKLLGSVYHRN